MKTKLLKSGGYFIVGLLVLSVITYLAGGEDSTAEENEAVAEMQAKGEAIQAEKDAEKKAKADAKANKEAKAEAEIADKLAEFETAKTAMIDNSSGVITEVTAEHTGVMYRAVVFVDEATWAGSNDSEKESFTTSIGTAIEQAFGDTTLVDFKSALNGDIIASEKVFGGYDIKR